MNEELEEWLERMIQSHMSMTSVVASSYVTAYRNVQRKIEELKSIHE